MNMTLIKTLQYAASGVSILMLAVACTGDSGSSGNLRFQDKSGVQSNKVLPAAAGRTVVYNITNTAIQPRNQDVDEATSSDESIFSVQSINESRVTIEAHSAGKATLTILTKNSKEDSLEIEVRDADTTYYSITELNDKSVEQGVLDVNGKYNLLLGDVIKLDGYRLFDAEGNRLSGDQIRGFESGSGGEMTVSTDELTAGAAGDTVTVDNAHGKTFSVRTITEDDYAPTTFVGYVHEMTLGSLDLSVLTMQTGKTFELKDSGQLLRIYPQDADGYTYIGSHAANANITVTNPDAVSLTYIGAGNENARDFCIDKTEDDKCKEYASMPEIAFMVTNASESGGTTELKITSGGATETFTLKL